MGFVQFTTHIIQANSDWYNGMKQNKNPTKVR